MFDKRITIFLSFGTLLVIAYFSITDDSFTLKALTRTQHLRLNQQRSSTSAGQQDTMVEKDNINAQRSLTSSVNAFLNFNGPWNECVGIKMEKCKNLIRRETLLSCNVEFVAMSNYYTTDYKVNRCRIFYDPETKKVVNPAPSRG